MSIEVIAFMLSELDVTNDRALSGSIAIELVKERIQLVCQGQASMYKVIILDFCMPGIDGPGVALAVTKLIKENELLGEDQMPLFCCTTAFNDPSYKKRALEAGMSHFLTKPVVEADLTNIIVNALK